jgi:hypothetical protein
MSKETLDDEAGSSDQIFASAKYYFPILICTRKEEPKKPGERSNCGISDLCDSYLLIVYLSERPVNHSILDQKTLHQRKLGPTSGKFNRL